MNHTVKLYRPCNLMEWELVMQSGYREWPPRLPEQPIFYPVTNLEYAREVNAWNVQLYGSGVVTSFDVNVEFMDRYEIKTVGAHYHTEWWIPAEDLAELNANIVGLISLVEQS